MIVDTSAMVAMALEEPECDTFYRLIRAAPVKLFCAASVLELHIVMSNKGRGASVDALLTWTQVEQRDVTSQLVAVARQAHDSFGRGRHSARLNFGDCFVYALAKLENMPVLFKGFDFSETDIEAVPY